MKFSNTFIKASDELCTFEKHINAPYFRRSFSLDFEPEQAEITICGLGFYELYINGTNITKGPLAPYIANNDDICYYDCYDIVKHLRKGKNVVGVLLGNGFRNPIGGFNWKFDKSRHVGPLCLAMNLSADGDGKNFTMTCDENFRTHPSPITFDDIRMGCRYDARLEITGWNLPGFDDSEWSFALPCQTPKGTPRLCMAEPIYVRQKIRPVSVEYFDSLPFAHKDTSPDSPCDPVTVREKVHVFDFGINTAGVTQLHVNGKRGQKITIRHGEYLVGGRFDMLTTMSSRAPDTKDLYYEYNQCDVYICRGGDETFTPRFKYDGFRYAFVDGLEPGQLTEDTLICLEMTSNIPQRAGFVSSDEKLTRLYDMTLQADRSNFFYFPTDCPHREKNGWTGDVSVSAEQLVLNFDAKNSFEEWLVNVRAAQRDDGAIPSIVPHGGWGFTCGDGPAWDAVIVNLPYYLYKYYGDTSVIADNAEMIDRYLHYAFAKRDERGLVAFGLGDWADPFRHDTGRIASPLEFTDSAQIYDVANKAAKLFEKAGLRDKADYAEKVAQEMRIAIRKYLVDDCMTVAGNCQTSQAMAIGMGVFDDCELEEARKRLIEIIHRDGDVTACGILGMRYIFHVLAQMGEVDLAYRLIVSESRSCYGYWLKNGFTSLCESFRDLTSGLVDSRNHHFFGDISSFFVQKIAGVQPNPNLEDTRSFVIESRFPKAVDSAEGYFDNKYGRLSCKWERTWEKIHITVTVPKGMHGSLVADGRIIPLTVGENNVEL